MTSYINNKFDKSTKLFGDDSIIPMLALTKNKKIIFNLVDTNENVFITKIKDIERIIDKLRTEKIIVVIRTTKGISQFQPLLTYLQDECNLIRIMEDNIEGTFVIFECTT